MIREIVNTNDDAFRFISGVRFNTDTVRVFNVQIKCIQVCWSYNNRTRGNCTKNLKKAVIIVEDWLNNGELPSGTSRDDLYAHVIELYVGKN